jgi:hypothetical protein
MGTADRSRDCAVRMAALAREEEFWQLKVRGLTYEEIGRMQKPPITKSAVGKVLRRWYKRSLKVAEQAGRQLRDEQGARLQLMIRQHTTQALAGDQKSAEIVLKCMEQQARLFGLATINRPDSEQKPKALRLPFAIPIDAARRLAEGRPVEVAPEPEQESESEPVENEVPGDAEDD